MEIQFLHITKRIYRSIPALMPLIIASIFLWSCTKDSPDSSQKDSFIKYFGGAYENIANDIVELDGYFYIIGTVYNNSSISFLRAIKADGYGNPVWTRDFSGTYSVNCADIIVLNDKSGVAILGTKADSASSDFYLLKLDLAGNTLLEKTYKYDYHQTGQSLVELTNGGYLLCGTGAKSATTSNEYLFCITTRPDGEPIRIPEAKGSLSISVDKLIALSNDTLPIGAGSIGDYPLLLIFSNQQGNDPSPISIPAIKGSFTDATQVSDDEILACGTIYNTSGNHSDGFIASLNISSELPSVNWQKSYKSDYNSQLNALTITSDNSIMLTGWQVTSAGDKNVWLLKTDLDGNEIGQKNFGYTDNEIGNAILETEDNKYVVEGTFYYESSSMITLLKTSFE